jgi:hypothetical protein
MVPLPRFKPVCDREFVIGQVYLMEPLEERSALSHRHFFAAIRETWLNLPHELADEFPNPEVLRKHALIRTGYCDAQSIVCNSKAEAQKVAAFSRDTENIVTVNGATVTRLTPQSQSMKAMGKERFQESKDAVLSFLADMLGTDAPSLSEAAEVAA